MPVSSASTGRRLENDSVRATGDGKRSATVRDRSRGAANLDHPNIVPIYEIGECEGHHYFSMKLDRGRDTGGFKCGMRSAECGVFGAVAELVAAMARAVPMRTSAAFCTGT